MFKYFYSNERKKNYDDVLNLIFETIMFHKEKLSIF